MASGISPLCLHITSGSSTITITTILSSIVWRLISLCFHTLVSFWETDRNLFWVAKEATALYRRFCCCCCLHFIHPRQLNTAAAANISGGDIFQERVRHYQSLACHSKQLCLLFFRHTLNFFVLVSAPFVLRQFAAAAAAAWWWWCSIVIRWRRRERGTTPQSTWI